MTRLTIIACMSLVPCTSAASPSKADPLELRLEVDTTRAGASGDVINRRIEERANVVLRRENVLPGQADDVRLQVEVVELTGDDPGFEIRLSLLRPGEQTSTSPVVVQCPLCTESELVTKVEAELGSQVPDAHALAQELEAEAAERAASTEPPTQDADAAPTPAREGPRPGTAMIAGGVASLAVAVAAIGAGVALAVPQPQVNEDNPLKLRTTRPPGYALLATGGALAITGAVLTALGVKRRRSASLALAPQLGPRSVGGVMLWRF